VRTEGAQREKRGRREGEEREKRGRREGEQREQREMNDETHYVRMKSILYNVCTYSACASL
jgi:hypothetical protein